MEISVRRAGTGDLDELAPLFDAYRRFYAQPGNVPAARAFLAERLARDESVVFIAEAGGHAAGFTQLYPLFTSVGLARIWLLNDLFVAADARRGGVAAALMGAAHAFARETGAAGVLLETGRGNAAAQALYRKLGYRLNESTDYFYLALDGSGPPLLR